MPKLDLLALQKLQPSGLLSPTAGAGGLSVGAGQIRTPGVAPGVQLQLHPKDASLGTTVGNSVANLAGALHEKALTQAKLEGQLAGQLAATKLYDNAIASYYGTKDKPGIISLSKQSFIDAAHGWSADYNKAIEEMSKSMDPYAASAFTTHALRLRNAEEQRVRANIVDVQKEVNNDAKQQINYTSTNRIAKGIVGAVLGVGLTDPGAVEAATAIWDSASLEDIARRNMQDGISDPNNYGHSDQVYLEVLQGIYNDPAGIVIGQAFEKDLMPRIKNPKLQAEAGKLYNAAITRELNAWKDPVDLAEVKEKHAFMIEKTSIAKNMFAQPNEAKAREVIALYASSPGANLYTIAYLKTLADAKFSDRPPDAAALALEAKHTALKSPTPDFLEDAAAAGIYVPKTMAERYSVSTGRTSISDQILHKEQLLKAAIIGLENGPRDIGEQVSRDISGYPKHTETESIVIARWRQYSNEAVAKGVTIDKAYATFHAETFSGDTLNAPAVKHKPEMSSIPSGIGVYPTAYKAATTFTALSEELQKDPNVAMQSVTKNGKTVPVTKILATLAKHADGSSEIRSQATEDFWNEYRALQVVLFEKAKPGNVPIDWYQDVSYQIATMQKRIETSKALTKNKDSKKQGPGDVIQPKPLFVNPFK